jgi:hypothetical protein
MSRRKDPGAAVIDFFQNAPVDAASTVLGICRSIVKTRLATAKKVAPGPDGDGLTPSQSVGFAQPGSDS